MQKKLTVLFAFAFFLLFVGWTITPAQAHTKFCDSEPEHKHCNPDDPDDGLAGRFSVKATFDDPVVCDGFCSDGEGPYEDGGTVKAIIDKFRFELTLLTGTLRRFFLDFGDPDNTALPQLSGGNGVGLTNPLSLTTFFSTATETSDNLLKMGIGTDLTRTLDIFFGDDNDVAWLLSFNPGGECDPSAVSTVLVTRFDAITWIFEPGTDATACLFKGKVGRLGRNPSFQGYYDMPFKITVELQP